MSSYPFDGDKTEDEEHEGNSGDVHGTNYEQDIKELHTQLDTKEEKLTDLKKRVKELETKNNDFEFQLEKKCGEVEDLKQRINELEEEKRKLQEELTGDEESLEHVHDTNYEQDIKELQTQFDTKEEKLTDLKKRVKELEKKNNDLEFQLEKKCDEVKDLKERTDELEEEKRTLQQELASVTFNLSNIKEEVKKLSKSKEAQEIKNITLEGKMRNVESSLKGVEEELEATRKQNEKLHSEIAQIRNQQRHVPGAPLRLPLQANQQQLAMSRLSVVSFDVQNSLYKIVLPDAYVRVFNYTIEQIENDIEKLPMPDEDREKARSRWENLKDELNLNDGNSQVLRSFRENRSVTECQTEDLDEQTVRKCIKFLDEEHLLKGWLTLEHITEVIEIWKKLK